jgi:hypothetical protein
MSLINEALKKAQRARTAGSPDDQPPLPGGGHVAKRGQARSANSIVLLGSGAVVLVVISVALTVYLINRPASPSQGTALSPKATPAPAVVEPAPVIVTPVIPAPPPVITAAPPPAASTTVSLPVAPPVAASTVPPVAVPHPPPAATTTAVDPAAPPSAVPTASQAAVDKPAPAAPPPQAPPPVSARPDERIAAYLESIRIAGLRAAGEDSRVLINERVYRVNDIIDRTLGVRLIAVTPGRLTFADGNGATYVKHL